MTALFILHGGRPTPVSNHLLCAVLAAAGPSFARVFGLPNGFAGAARTDLVELTDLMAEDAGEMRAALARTPGAWLGSSVHSPDEVDYSRILDLMRARDGRKLLAIADRAALAALADFAAFAETQGWPVAVTGVANTICNDIEGRDFTPGFASAARALALAVRGVDRDLRATREGERVALVEVPGGGTGWLAAAACAFRAEYDDPPHLVLTPERGLDPERLPGDVDRLLGLFGRAVVVANEGAVAGPVPWRRLGLGPLLRTAEAITEDIDLATEAARLAMAEDDMPSAGPVRPFPADLLSARPPHVSSRYADRLAPVIGTAPPFFRPAA